MSEGISAADVMEVIRRHDHHPRTGSMRRGLAWLAAAGLTTLVSAVPPAEQDPVQIRRIADVEGRPVDDAPQVVGNPGTTMASRVAAFDPLEVRRIDLQAVEASIGDRGALDLSLRWIDPGLRLPTGYDQVYSQAGGGFWRADGGLIARFDQSIYVSTGYGPRPDIPASTVFVIGGVPMGGEVGHGRLLPVDPLDPGLVPPLSGPVAAPDEWHTPSAVPGDRFARFGFGPGYRVPVRVDGTVPATRHVSSRFQRDPSYRASRLARMLIHWRAADRDDSDPHGSEGDPPGFSPGCSGSEADPSNPGHEVPNPDRGS